MPGTNIAIPPENIHNLVFAGGSVKGIAYVGAFEILAQQCDMSQIKRVAGASAGSIFALLVALGYEVHEMRHILEKFCFIDILDGDSKAQTKIRSAVDSGNYESEKGLVKKAIVPIVWQLKGQLGIFTGEYFREWTEKLISSRIKEITGQSGENLTFNRLAELGEQYPRLRQLYVVGCNLSLSKPVIFCAGGEMGDVVIADAIRISMSIPGVFQPHTVYRNIGGERVPDGNNHVWIDGGWFDNYPIGIFDKIEGPQYTLGFNLVNESEQDCLAGLSSEPTEEIDNILQFGLALFKSTLHRQTNEFLASEANQSRTIAIPSMGVNMLDFNLDAMQQQELINSGKRKTLEAFGIPLPKELEISLESNLQNLPLTETHNLEITSKSLGSKQPNQGSTIRKDNDKMNFSKNRHTFHKGSSSSNSDAGEELENSNSKGGRCVIS